MKDRSISLPPAVPPPSPYARPPPAGQQAGVGCPGLVCVLRVAPPTSGPSRQQPKTSSALTQSFAVWKCCCVGTPPPPGNRSGADSALGSEWMFAARGKRAAAPFQLLNAGNRTGKRSGTGKRRGDSVCGLLSHSCYCSAKEIWRSPHNGGGVLSGLISHTRLYLFILTMSSASE